VKVVSATKIILIAGLLISNLSIAATKTSNHKKELVTIQNTEQFLLTAPNGRKFRIMVSHPYPDDPTLDLSIKGRKPVPIYVLDGGDTFGLFSMVTRYMRWGGELPPTMVIAIGYENEQEALDKDYRRYDLTPQDSKFISWNGKHEPHSVGGGPEFRKFITQTLKPLIEERYEVDSANSVLYGHSLGGLFALNTMLEAPNVFNRILALSPSIWFADNRLLKTLKGQLEDQFKFSGKLAVYTGEKEERIAGPEYKMASNVLSLAALTFDHKSKFEDITIRVLPNQSHHTIPAIAAVEGLQFLLSPESKRQETF